MERVLSAVFAAIALLSIIWGVISAKMHYDMLDRLQKSDIDFMWPFIFAIGFTLAAAIFDARAHDGED